MTKKVIGILLSVLGAALLSFVVISIGMNLAQSGPWQGKITTYRQPFYGHGVLMIYLGIAAVLSFLGGIILITLNKLN